MEPSETAISKDKIDLIMYFQGTCRDEANFLRERQDKIFTWSSNILFAVIAALFVVDTTKLVTLAKDPVARTVATFAILFFALFSIHWQNRNREWQRQNLEVVNRINYLLHAFEEGYFDTANGTALFPDEWKDTGGIKLSLWNRIRRVNYVTATVILALLDIVMIWVVG